MKLKKTMKNQCFSKHLRLTSFSSVAPVPLMKIRSKAKPGLRFTPLPLGFPNPGLMDRLKTNKIIILDFFALVLLRTSWTWEPYWKLFSFQCVWTINRNRNVIIGAYGPVNVGPVVGCRIVQRAAATRAPPGQERLSPVYWDNPRPRASSTIIQRGLAS